MGTISLLKQKNTDFLLNAWTTTSDIVNPEYGTVYLDLSSKLGNEYQCTICTEDYSPKWVKKFFRAFIDNPKFREQFSKTVNKVNQCHPTETIIIDNKAINIDKEIVKPIIKLNHFGCKTVFCCQGGNDSVGYISLNYDGKPFPIELIDVWRSKLKFYTTPWSVHAQAPYGLNGYATKAFYHSLNDWEQGILDKSGKKYLWKVKRPDSRPVLPEIQQHMNITHDKNLIENY